MSTIDKTLLILARIGVFCTPFVPLVITASMFFPFITGKNFTFRIIVEVVFACWLLLALRQPQFRPKQSALLWSVGAFLLVVFLADAFAENPFKAFWSNFERMEGFITLAHLGAYFLVAGSVLNEEKWWYRFFATSVGVSAFLGIYGILQLAGKIVINQGGARLDGTFGNAAYFAGYMLFHIFLTLFLLFRHRAPLFVKWLYGGAFALQLFTLYFTATRGAFVGLVVGLAAAACLTVVFERESKRLRRYTALIAVAILVLVTALFLAKGNSWVRNNTVLSRFASISVEAAGPRFMVWGMAMEGFREHPVLGWGQEGFNYVFNKYYNPDMWTQEQWFDRTHNIFFDWLISAGLLGLLAYLSLFAFLLWYIWKGKPAGEHDAFSFAEKSILTGLLAAYVIHNFFVFDNLVSYLLFFSLLAYVHMRMGKPLPAFETRPLLGGSRAYAMAGAVALLFVAGAVYFLNIRGIVVARYLIEGLKTQAKGISENLSFYKKAFAFETIGTQETAEQVVQAALTVAVSQQVPQGTRDEFVSFAEQAMGREISRAPEDARLRMFMGGFYNRLGRYADALTQLEKAHALSLAKQTISFELANTYLSSGKNDEALTLLKGTFDLAPEFQKARTVYAVGAIYLKQFSLADALIASSTEKSAQADEQMVRAYFAVKRYDKVIGILKRQLETNSSNAQTHISLAAAYLANGNRAEAVSELQKTIELNPDFKQQGEYYINEIRAGRNP